MFEIDLLKGKNRPTRRSLKKTVLQTVPFIIPLIAAAGWATSYSRDCTLLRIETDQIQKNQMMIDDAQEAIASYRHTNGRINATKKCIETISKGLAYRIQVSDLLVELVQTLPDDIFINEINLERDVRLEKVRDPQTKEEKQWPVVERNMTLTLCGFDPIKCDQQVREYINHLKTSKVLADVFTEIKPAARQQGRVDERSAIYYEIECTFREQEER